MEGRERLHPKPNGPFPDPESYESERDGPKPERPGLVNIGTVREPVPVTGFAANFSPIPRMAPPPFGRDMAGKLALPFGALLRSDPVVPVPEVPALFLLYNVCVDIHLSFITGKLKFELF